MSEPIRIGDLVVILRTHCMSPTLGRIGLVTDVELPHSAWCNCGKFIQACGAKVEGAGWHPMQWLKRIPPLSELEGEKRDEEITA